MTLEPKKYQLQVLDPSESKVDSKAIFEFIGRANTGDEGLSVAKLSCPEGWSEPFQTPEFDEITVVTHGELRLETGSGALSVKAGQAITIPRGSRVRYSSPSKGGAEFIAICQPAYSPQIAHREE